MPVRSKREVKRRALLELLDRIPLPPSRTAPQEIGSDPDFA